MSLAWMGHQVLRDPRFRVRHVVVEDVTPRSQADAPRRRHASDAEVRHLANIRMDEPLWRSELDRAVDGVLTHPWVKSAETVRRWPDTVVIRVAEHIPVMLLKHRGLYYVDTDGRVFKRARADDLDYPVLTGLEPALADRQGAVAERVVLEAIRVLGAVAASGELTTREISEVRFHADDGFTLMLRNNSELALGWASPTECLHRLRLLREAGVPPRSLQRIDLAPSKVAVVTPLEPPIPPTHPLSSPRP